MGVGGCCLKGKKKRALRLFLLGLADGLAGLRLDAGAGGLVLDVPAAEALLAACPLVDVLHFCGLLSCSFCVHYTKLYREINYKMVTKKIFFVFVLLPLLPSVRRFVWTSTLLKV